MRFVKQRAFVKQWTITATIALTSFVVSTSTAWAQKPSKPPGDDSVTMQWTIAIGLMVVIGVSAFLNPKRSHLN